MCFFSSRRRRTRYWRDWSSDVCSSDLTVRIASSGGLSAVHLARHEGAVREILCHLLRVPGGRGGPAPERAGPAVGEIGRASRRERVQIWVGAGSFKKKQSSGSSFVRAS